MNNHSFDNSLPLPRHRVSSISTLSLLHQPVPSKLGRTQLRKPRCHADVHNVGAASKSMSHIFEKGSRLIVRDGGDDDGRRHIAQSLLIASGKRGYCKGEIILHVRCKLNCQPRGGNPSPLPLHVRFPMTFIVQEEGNSGLNSQSNEIHTVHVRRQR